MDTIKNTLTKTLTRNDENIFIPRPDRTMEWLGGVTYANLDNVLEKLKRFMLESPREEVHLFVNSYGGSTGIGMSFFDSVKTLYKTKLYTIGSGDVDSSGIIIFLSGEKRFLAPNTTMLLHLGGRTFENDKRFSTADMERILSEDRLKDRQYASVVSDSTNGRLSVEKVLEMMSRHTILTAEEAVNLGIAHQILR